ncbi:MAG: hypothetical protein AB3N14_16660 [Flavobacteriaceae bacterium]
MITRLILYVLILAPICSIGQEKNNSFHLHFVDDYENNIVSLEINGNKILDSLLFRESVIPGFRGKSPLDIKITEDKAIIYYKDKVNKEFEVQNVIMDEPINIKLITDDKVIEKKFNIEYGRYVIISYNKGKVYLRQSKIFM